MPPASRPARAICTVVAAAASFAYLRCHDRQICGPEWLTPSGSGCPGPIVVAATVLMEHRGSLPIKQS